MRFDKGQLLLYAVTDRTWVGDKTLVQQVKEAIKGGATCIQLREKHMDKDEFYREAGEISALCRSHGVPLIINDDVEAAVRCGADGVHVGQNDMNARDVRRMIGHDMILGVSAQTEEQARKAVDGGADYLGVGTVFPTSTKKDAVAVARDTLTEICRTCGVPVVAIGGINKNNIGRLTGTGIAGVALVSAIFSSRDITAACRELRALSEKAISSSWQN